MKGLKRMGHKKNSELRGFSDIKKRKSPTDGMRWLDKVLTTKQEEPEEKKRKKKAKETSKRLTGDSL